MSTTIEQMEKLREVVEDESLTLSARRDAATHLTDLRVAGVPAALDSDEEVKALMTPWSDPVFAAQWAEASKGRSVNGWSLRDALAEVTQRRKLRVLLSSVCDESLSRVERLASAEKVLADFMQPGGFYRRNQYTSQRLLENIRPQAGKVPMTLSDVWSC